MKKAIILSILLLASAAHAADVKDADLAGSWYPASKDELASLLKDDLDRASPANIDGRIFAIISPHAGYRFSAPVAAYGYKLVEGRPIKTVVIIGFTHRKPFNGISVYDRGSFRTPLGDVRVDAALAAELISKSPRIGYYPEAFSGENSVEMQVPFIQAALPQASIVPVAFGTQSYSDAEALASSLADALRGRDDYLIVASTDLSHYHPYAEANAIDAHMMTLLGTKDPKALYDEARLGISELCGIMPVTATMLAARRLGFDGVKILKYANSGDTYGDKSKVVGYLSAVVYGTDDAAGVTAPEREDARKAPEERMLLNSAQRKRLLQIARESLTSYVRDGKRADFTENDKALNEPFGAFVTLHEKGDLRGCIGNMSAQGPLYKTVASMAIEASVDDPRFPPLSPSEIGKVDIEISVLSPMKKVSGAGEITIPGHGVLVRKGFRSGVYLPQVAVETGWNKEQFLTSLCAHKAGLAPDAWKDPATEMYVFNAEVFGEKEGSK
jgi:AmmeMemoRadiSam system protein B/AmmeMemoRadiSam system protein A